MLKLTEQQVIRNATFTELQEQINNGAIPSLAGFTCEGQCAEGLLIFNTELDQWALIRCIFKKDGFDGVDAIEEYKENIALKEAEKEKKAKAKK